MIGIAFMGSWFFTNHNGSVKGQGQKAGRNPAIKKVQEPVKCPYCGSTQIQAVRKGFSGGKAIIGGIVAGPIGLAAGAIGSDKIERFCLNCGHKF